MSIISTTVLALSMSADAFAAAVGKGTSLKKPKIQDAAYIGMVFGIVEAITPIIGWLAGLAAGSFVQSVDHWLAFSLLGIVGSKMIYESLHKDPETIATTQQRLGTLILTAIGTSIDAMAIGASLAVLDANIWVSAVAIGLATFLMATIGIMTGHYIGNKGGKIAEAVGGIGLILIGTSILIEHLK